MEFSSRTIYSKRLYASRLVRASHSVARTTRTPTTSSYLPPPTFLVPAERRGQPLSSRALQDARSRRGVASDGSRVARKQSFQRKLSRARALRLDARDARRERRGRRVVTRARRARRAWLRASRPVAARAASRTRFRTLSRHVSVKARREACFTRFAFSRVLFFRLGFGFRLSRVFIRFFVRHDFKKKKKKETGVWEFRSCNGQTLSQVRRLQRGRLSRPVIEKVFFNPPTRIAFSLS